MKKDNINTLFENLEGSFDVHETPAGHELRFMERLNTAREESASKWNWWKPLSIAASLAVIIALGSMFMKSTPTEMELASVSPEMEQTQSFFTETINEELDKLKSLNTPDAKNLVDDAMLQISVLETEYNELKKDLAVSGNDKRVIYAMISNFQSRIDLLQNVIETIDEIKNLKAYRDETTI